MTTLDVALTGTEVTNTKGQHTLVRHLDAVANAVIATALINQSAFSFPITALTVDSTSAGWGNILPGMTALIGSTPGGSDVAIIRVHSGSNSTTLAIAETSIGDAGLLPSGVRPATFNDDQYVTVVDTSNFYSIIPIIVGQNTYEDFNRTAGNNNTNPAPLAFVSINNSTTRQNNHWAGYVDSGQSYATLTFTATSELWPTSASATYAWTLPAAFTVTGGATNTNTVTCQVPHAATNYVVRLVVTENSVSQTQQRVINVWVHDKSGANAPLIISDMSGDGWDDKTGASFTFTLNDNLLATIPDGAMICVWDELTFNGALIPSAVSQFVGWLARETKHAEPGTRQTDCEFVGPAGLLALRRGMSQVLSVSGSGWQQAPASVLSLSFLMWWIAKNRGTILDYFDFNIYSTNPVGQRLPTIIADAGPLWTQLQALAQGIQSCTIGCDPDGTIWVTQEPSLIIYSSRASIVKRFTVNQTNLHDYDAPRELVPKVGWLQGEAFIWDGVATLPTPLLAIAPGSAPGQGVSDQRLQSQVVDSQNTLDILTGYYYAMLNPDYGPLTLRMQGNWGALIKPAQSPMLPVSIPALNEPSGVAFSRNVIPTAVKRTFTRASDGVSFYVDTEITADIETAGNSAETRPVPLANNALYGATAAVPPVVAGAFGATNSANPVTAKGVILATQDGHAARGIIWGDCSPTTDQSLSIGNTLKMIADAWAYQRIYLFGTLGAVSTDDMRVSAPSWRLLNIGSPISPIPITHTFDFTLSNGGFAAAPEDGTGYDGTYSAGVGWQGNNPAIAIALPQNAVVVSVSATLSASHDVQLSLQRATSYPSTIAWHADSYGIIQQTGTAIGGTFPNSPIRAASGNYLSIAVSTPTAAVTILNLTVTFLGTDPFAGGSGSAETFIADILASINRRGFFAWLSRKTVGGTDFVYVNTTSDYFQSTSSLLDALYSATINPGLALSCYGNGVGYATAGDTGLLHSAQYRKMSGYFTAFTGGGADINAHGGAVNIPYAQGGGAANSGSSPQFIVITGLSGANLQCLALDGTLNTITGGSRVPYGNQSLNTFTQDGNYVAVITTDGAFFTSSDGGKTWTAKTATPLHGATAIGVNGSPQNHSFYIVFGDQLLAYTTDGGTTWTDLWTAYNTFRSGAYGAGGKVIVTAMIDLALIYGEKAVTQ